MKLRCLDGDQAGKILSIDGSGITIGRDADCTLQFDEDGVSRRHARIMMETKKPVVVDLNSTNGVRVNGERIAGRKVLVDGDRVGIGSRIMLVTADGKVGTDRTPAAKRIKNAAQPAAATTPAKSGGNAPLIVILLLLACAAGYFVMTGQRGTPPAVPPSEDVVAAPDVPPPPTPPRPQPAPIGNTDVGLIDPSTEPLQVPKTRKDTGFYFVNTTPPGASVEIDGELVGRTPLFVPEMTGGTHALRLRLDGYEDHTRAFYVPARDQFASIALAPSPGTCLITTDPPGATILRGAQILGTAPLLLRDLGPGDHQIRVAEYGYATTTQKISISQFRADSVHVTLPPTTGTIAVTTLPAKATLYLDGVSKGTSKPGADPSGESEPIIISGMTRGTHQLEIEFDGRRSRVHRVAVTPGEAVSAQLAVWMPDILVRTISGKNVTGMLLSKNELGDLVIQVNPRGAPISLLNTQITNTRKLTRAEIQVLLDKVDGDNEN